MAELTRSSVMHFSRTEIVSILFGLILAMFLASLDQTIVATSLSTMARDLNGWTLISWVVSAYLVASTVTSPIYGRLVISMAGARSCRWRSRCSSAPRCSAHCRKICRN
jgi:MFS family permease